MRAILLLLAAATAADATELHERIVAMLRNFQQNGSNPDGSGLWINWRYGSQPLQVNLNGSGLPDGPEVKRHDVLTDLRYLHNLLLYRHVYPGDPQFDGETERYGRIVKREFAGTRNERGWLYDELIDMYRISHDEFFRETARGLAKNYATSMYREPPGIYFKSNAKRPDGYYRVDLVLEIGCGLVQAGGEFHEPSWVEKGRRMVQYVIDHAYIARYHAFLTQMEDVANANQKILRDRTAKTAAEGGSVRLGSMGQIVTSLLHAYMASHDQVYLDRALEILDGFSADRNELGLWDAKDLGYFASAVFPGPDFQHPGEPRLNSAKKESGRQLHILEAYRLANTLAGNRYRKMEEMLRRVAMEKAWYAPGNGYLYEQKADWSLVTAKNGKSEDWVTAEAMGIAMLGLYAVERKDPW